MPQALQPRKDTQSPSPSSTSPAQTEKPPLDPGDICVGCIVWLPPRELNNQCIKCEKRNCCGKTVLDDGGYNHPVVVVKIRQKKGSALIGDLVCSVACVSESPANIFEVLCKIKMSYAS